MKILSIILVFLLIGCNKEIAENRTVEWDAVYIHDGYTKIVCETSSVIDTSNTILQYGKFTFFNNGKYTQTGFTVFEKDIELKWSSDSTSLKLYDEGEAKEGVGCGGALCYAAINGLAKEEVIKKIESFLGV